MSADSKFRVQAFGTHNKKVVFFFAGMGTRTWLYTLPIKRLVRHGYQVIAYDFKALVVRHGDANSFLRLAEEVSTSVQQHIKQAEQQDITDFVCFGTSMGTLLAIKCAAENPQISKIIINLTYGSVAENIWTWWFIKPTKRKAIRQGYTTETLDQKLAPVSPIPNAKRLKGKQVLLYLSKRDKVLLFNQSSQFKQALDRHGVTYQYVQNNRRGHVLTGYSNFKHHHIYVKFLSS